METRQGELWALDPSQLPRSVPRPIFGASVADYLRVDRMLEDDLAAIARVIHDKDVEIDELNAKIDTARETLATLLREAEAVVDRLRDLQVQLDR